MSARRKLAVTAVAALALAGLLGGAEAASAGSNSRVQNGTPNYVQVQADNGSVWSIPGYGYVSGYGVRSIHVPVGKCISVVGATSGTYCFSRGGWLTVGSGVTYIQRIYTR